MKVKTEDLLLLRQNHNIKTVTTGMNFIDFQRHNLDEFQKEKKDTGSTLLKSYYIISNLLGIDRIMKEKTLKRPCE